MHTQSASPPPIGSDHLFSLRDCVCLQGYAAAMYSAGVMHVQGPPTVEQNPQKGLVWLEKAAALGDLHAMYNTGFMLSQGLGGEERMRDGAHFLHFVLKFSWIYIIKWSFFM